MFTIQKSGVMHTGGTSASQDNIKSGTVVLTARGCEFSETISASYITLNVQDVQI